MNASQRARAREKARDMAKSASAVASNVDNNDVAEAVSSLTDAIDLLCDVIEAMDNDS